jgi:hypothetical protein
MGSIRDGVSGESAAVPSLTEPPGPNPEFAEPAEEARIARAARALEESGIVVHVVADGAAAREMVNDMLPEQAEVFNATSVTLTEIGLAEDIERSGRYRPLRPRLYSMDRQFHAAEIRKLAAAPDWFVGSAHAVTEDGSVMIASATGSQLGPIASGAGKVILVAGAQKIVADRERGFRRIYEYCYPLEDQRVRAAQGLRSGVNQVLIINRLWAPGRVVVLLVKQKLGF